MALYRQLLDSPILALPPELVLHILSYLQVNDLVHCIPVCNIFQSIIQDSSRLQYDIHLAKSLMQSSTPLDSPNHPSSHLRLTLIKNREAAWKYLRWGSTHRLVLPPTGSIYEFVGGVYGNGREDAARVTSSISFIQLPSSSEHHINAGQRSILRQQRDHRPAIAAPDNMEEDDENEGMDDDGLPSLADLKTWTHIIGDVRIVDFTMDPAQDLLVLVTLAPKTCVHVYQLHLRSLATNQPHNAAPLSVIPCLLRSSLIQIPFALDALSAVRVQISGNLVALLIKEAIGEFGGFLQVWNWELNPHNSVELSRPSGIDDFTFLSPNFLLLARPVGRFEVYYFNDPATGSNLPILRSTYAFPSLGDGYMFWYITISNNPSAGYRPRGWNISNTNRTGRKEKCKLKSKGEGKAEAGSKNTQPSEPLMNGVSPVPPINGHSAHEHTHQLDDDISLPKLKNPNTPPACAHSSGSSTVDTSSHTVQSTSSSSSSSPSQYTISDSENSHIEQEANLLRHTLKPQTAVNAGPDTSTTPIPEAFDQQVYYPSSTERILTCCLYLINPQMAFTNVAAQIAALGGPIGGFGMGGAGGGENATEENPDQENSPSDVSDSTSTSTSPMDPPTGNSFHTQSETSGNTTINQDFNPSSTTTSASASQTAPAAVPEPHNHNSHVSTFVFFVPASVFLEYPEVIRQRSNVFNHELDIEAAAKELEEAEAQAQARAMTEPKNEKVTGMDMEVEVDNKDRAGVERNWEAFGGVEKRDGAGLPQLVQQQRSGGKRKRSRRDVDGKHQKLRKEGSFSMYVEVPLGVAAADPAPMVTRKRAKIAAAAATESSAINPIRHSARLQKNGKSRVGEDNGARSFVTGGLSSGKRETRKLRSHSSHNPRSSENISSIYPPPFSSSSSPTTSLTSHSSSQTGDPIIIDTDGQCAGIVPADFTPGTHNSGDSSGGYSHPFSDSSATTSGTSSYITYPPSTVYSPLPSLYSASTPFGAPRMSSVDLPPFSPPPRPGASALTRSASTWHHFRYAPFSSYGSTRADNDPRRRFLPPFQYIPQPNPNLHDVVDPNPYLMNSGEIAGSRIFTPKVQAAAAAAGGGVGAPASHTSTLSAAPASSSSSSSSSSAATPGPPPPPSLAPSVNSRPHPLFNRKYHRHWHAASDPPPPVNLSWSQWGPLYTRWFEDSISTDWQHAVFGTRTVECVGKKPGQQVQREVGEVGEGNTMQYMGEGATEGAGVGGSSATPAGNDFTGQHHWYPCGEETTRRHLRIRNFNPYAVAETRAEEKEEEEGADETEAARTGEVKLAVLPEADEEEPMEVVIDNEPVTDTGGETEDAPVYGVVNGKLDYKGKRKAKAESSVDDGLLALQNADAAVILSPPTSAAPIPPASIAPTPIPQLVSTSRPSLLIGGEGASGTCQSSTSPASASTCKQTPHRPRVITERTITPSKGCFQHDILSCLPYTEVITKEKFDVTDVMIDGERVLLLKRARGGRLKHVDVLTF